MPRRAEAPCETVRPSHRHELAYICLEVSCVLRKTATYQSWLRGRCPGRLKTSTQAGIFQARIGNVPGGFSVSIELRRGNRLDTWGVSLVTEFEAAEDVVRLFAGQHAIPWKDVEVVRPASS
jgi:hypothetical protein